MNHITILSIFTFSFPKYLSSIHEKKIVLNTSVKLGKLERIVAIVPANDTE